MTIVLRPLEIPEVQEIRPQKLVDSRGFFSEVYSEDVFAGAGLPTRWVQENHSLSRAKHTLRGLHFQSDPFAQDKLVRVLRGSIFDVAVDIREGSATFGRWVSLLLSAETFNAIFIPKGFAHGFLTLENECEVGYRVSQRYDPPSDRNIAWNDQTINVQWPLDGAMPILSDKDRNAPQLSFFRDIPIPSFPPTS